MAGHNKWSKIKHRKAHVEKKKTRLWSKVSRAIMVAARNGGPDPASNLNLRYAIDEARYANMPRDTIARAIKKGAGELLGENWEGVRYEGYGPGGAAIIVETLTNNRTRTAGDLRLQFGKFGGNLGSIGCVAFMFESRGQILVPAAGLTEERVMEAAIEAGADDVQPPAEPEDEDAAWLVLTAPTAFQRVKERLEAAKLPISEAQIAMIPSTRVEARGEQAKNLVDLVDGLEELDDVQKVWSNFDIPDEELAKLSA